MIPRLPNCLASSAAASSSSCGISRGSISTIVTCEPNRWKIDANSQPMIPPPSTTRRSGTRSWASSPVESTHRCESSPSIGGRIGYEPVATIALLNVTSSPPSTAIVFGYGGWLVYQGDMSTGTLFAFALYLSNFFDPIQQLSQLYNTFLSAIAALDKIVGVLDEQPQVVDAADARALPRIDGRVRFEGVRFRYAPGLPEVLHGLDPDQRELFLEQLESVADSCRVAAEDG